MSTLGLIEYKDASPEVRAVYDDIMTTRKTDWINNFWKAIAHDPATLKRTWEDIKQIMAPGALEKIVASGSGGAVSGNVGFESFKRRTRPGTAANACSAKWFKSVGPAEFRDAIGSRRNVASGSFRFGGQVERTGLAPKGGRGMNIVSQLFGVQTPVTPFDTPSSTPTTPTTQTNQGGSQASPSNELTANSFITLLTTQLQAQDPLNPLDPNQMVNELTTMNTLQQIMQIRQDMDALLAAAKAGGGTMTGTGTGTGNTGGSANGAAAAAAAAIAGLTSSKL